MNRLQEACPPLRFWHLAILFGLALALRLLSMPDHNLAEDSFTLIEAAKHLLATGIYRMPGVGSAHAVLEYTLPSWPVGFPLTLAGVFAIFGASEAAARTFTVVVSSFVAPLTAAIANLMIRNERVALTAGILAAIHPLSVGFSGQVFTNNLSAALFAASLYFLTACLARGDRIDLVSLREVCRSKGRQLRLALAFFFFGFMLSVRDTDVIFAPVGVYLLYLGGIGSSQTGERDWAAWRRCLLIGIGALLVGWAPSLYFNVINFGSPLVSTHYQTGIRLSLDYLLRGSDAFFGLPGIVVMAVVILGYHFPAFVSLFFLRQRWSAISPFVVMGILVILPLLLVNGAFPVVSTGAGPRYVLPLVPFVAIVSAYALYLGWCEIRRWTALLFIGVVVGWQVLLTYPPVMLFELWPRFAYLTYYSPVYVSHPYHHYPDHTNAMVQWVRENTPTTAIIVTPSRAQHFLYYGKRDVVILNLLTPAHWSALVSERPVYLVEDRDVAVKPTIIESLKEKLGQEGIVFKAVGAVEVFTPEKGDTMVRVYLASKAT